jgi:glyoxylase-like metal-dependent hydrolase (beta-lactamase superfamily II)
MIRRAFFRVLVGLALTAASGLAQAAPAAKLALEVYTAAPEAFGVTSTLIYGPTEAVLVDAQFTVADAQKLADRIAAVAPGRKLKAIVITHPHPDHYFGTAVLRGRFPGTPILMSAAGIADWKTTVAGKLAYWGGALGAAVPKAVPTPEPLPAALTVDGEPLEIVAGLQGDVLAPVNSYVWVPSLQTAVVGDLAYAGTHVWLAESNAVTRAAWKKSLRVIAARHPKVVVAGHKASAQTPDSPASLDEVAAYIDAFEAAKAQAKDAAGLIAAMKKAYPNTALEPVLAIAADAAFPH